MKIKETMLDKVFEFGDVLINPSRAALRDLAQPGEMTTRWGSPAYISRVRSRSAAFTVTDIDDGFSPEDLDEVRAVREYLSDKEMLQVDRVMGMDAERSFRCRLYIRPSLARVAMMWQASLFAHNTGDARGPDFVTVYVPEWHRRRILVSLETGLTLVLGVDYYGESKMSFLRQAMYAAKTRWGGIGLHAGSKLLTVRNAETNELQERGAIFFGLSGTGKTSLTCHHHELEGEETVEILQDDIVFMDANGACYGTEEGFYIKTEGLDPKDQELLYDAAISENAIFENTWVGPDREVDFENGALTGNGRALVLRPEVKNTSERIDLKKSHLVFFITRNQTIVPPVARLNPAQAAAAFMLGESIKTSAADPTAKGEPVRCVGTNPFIVGSLSAEGNRFYDIIKRNADDIECFLLNTGKIGGPQGEKISLMASQAIIRELARGTVQWKKDADWGYETPVSIPGLEVEQFEPQRFYSDQELNELTSELKADRQEWLSSFPGLDEEIVEVFQ